MSMERRLVKRWPLMALLLATLVAFFAAGCGGGTGGSLTGALPDREPGSLVGAAFEPPPAPPRIQDLEGRLEASRSGSPASAGLESEPEFGQFTGILDLTAGWNRSPSRWPR